MLWKIQPGTEYYDIELRFTDAEPMPDGLIDAVISISIPAGIAARMTIAEIEDAAMRRWETIKARL